MPNDSGNRRHRTEHNKKRNVLVSIVCVRVKQKDKINQGRTREKKSAKKRVISAIDATATAAGASSDAPQ
jgi:hypothetical protein